MQLVVDGVVPSAGARRRCPRWCSDTGSSFERVWSPSPWHRPHGGLPRRRGGATRRAGDRVCDERSSAAATSGQPRSSWTASGVCSRTMNRSACGGRRSRVSRRPPPSSRTRPARSTPPAGRAARRAQPGRWRRSSSVQHDGGAGAEPADQQPGDGAGGGEPAPPDAEHEQRAERRGGHRERQADRRATPTSGASSDDQARHQHGDDGRDPERRRRPAAGGPHRRPMTSWLSTPATAIVSPDEVERNAANAPAVTSPVSRSPREPVDHQPRQLEHHRVARPASASSGA